ncbi:Hpt domain-containing protein [Polyangium jinanense]|uniref:Hpt domain-containing protein n=1 Tax=Polyangium jinanense TaxID=2829994 RepID=A0A9X3X862_9BACT|nr:Hpt domain-containing protein [Polyangium jinanense]MDC3959310.1 Hpt domain-containing protein [Polyangium jinanense]MDC3985719.1 Hpt domain-containing protein [Polyangium jinanense]
MAHTKDDEIRAALLELRREYLAELPGLLEQLAEVVSAAKQGSAKDAMRVAVSRAHALRGTAGSYRFQDISDAAGLIEDGLLGIQGGWLPPEQAWPEIERALASARAACDRAGAALKP